MERNDLYEILGVAETASSDEIRKAYRKLAGKYHPDRNSAADAAEKMKEVNDAYATLSDDEKRNQYDMMRKMSGHRAFGSFDFDSIFGNAFSEMFGNFSERPQSRGFGAVSCTIEISLSKALSGGRHRISLPSIGSFEIDLPKGIASGSRFQLSHPDGRVIDLTVVVISEQGWSVSGDDLLCEMGVPPWTVALGGEVEIKHPSGDVLRVSVPAGMQPGAKLRLRGKGVSSSGDLFVVCKVVVPSPTTKKEKDLYAKLAALHSEK